ncbi:histidine phosphatase family protein, partial [Streptomyces somaliensis DSM 40738]|uniref:histidine phosphatase family protein n=1 Tax=Streptomyces somaliensis TaxID=78355 RepID=UPI0021C3BDD6
KPAGPEPSPTARPAGAGAGHPAPGGTTPPGTTAGGTAVPHGSAVPYEPAPSHGPAASIEGPAASAGGSTAPRQRGAGPGGGHAAAPDRALDAPRSGDGPSPSAAAPAPSAGGGAAATPATPSVGWAAPADLGAPATFVLLRHGETALTPEKRFSGSGGTDPELSPAGRRQAEAAAAAFAARGTVQEVVSSPLLRCRQTALAVAGRLGLDVRIEDGLRETDFGAWEGLTFAEVRERYPDDLDAWLASPRAAPPGGESFAAVSRRVAAVRDRLTERHAGRTVLLVTHVTPIKTLVRLALGAPPEALFRMELSAASVSAVAYYRDGNASVRLLNDTSHLR